MKTRHLLLAWMILLMGILLGSTAAGARAGTYVGIVDNGRILIPLRGVLEEFGATVRWDETTGKIIVNRGNNRVELTPGFRMAWINGQKVQLDSPARVLNGRTYIPLRVAGEAIGAKVEWDQTGGKAVISEAGKTVTVGLPCRGITSYVRNIPVGGRAITATVVEIPVGSAVPAVGLAQDRVGGVEDLASIAKRHGAVAAINGTYFEAYAGVPEPWGTLIKDGRVIHLGDVGTVLGITADGRVKMAAVKAEIWGNVNGDDSWSSKWYAYNFNRTATLCGSAAYIHTPERGATVGYARGVSVIVAGNKVANIVRNQEVGIPRNGYVINFHGDTEVLADRFKVGDTANYGTVFRDRFTGEELDWSDVVVGVGAGPRLITNGAVSANPAAEGFSEAKILTGGGARSAFGVKANGDYLLVTVPGATVYQMAAVMQQLGCVDAMCLDGGASSGLYFNGKYLTPPGRKISNALLFVP